MNYEERGLMTADNRTLGGNAYNTAFSYDSAGRTSTITYASSGWMVGYARDAAGLSWHNMNAENLCRIYNGSKFNKGKTMKFFNRSLLMDLFFPERRRDLLLGNLLQLLRSEGPSRNTRNIIVQLVQKYPNHQGVENCLSHAIGYIDAYYGKKAAYAITQDLCNRDRGYSRVRTMAERKACVLLYDMTFEPPVLSYKNDVRGASRQAVSICEQFMNGPVKDSLVNYQGEEIKPIGTREFYNSLKY